MPDKKCQIRGVFYIRTIFLRIIFLLLAAATAIGQSKPKIGFPNTEEAFRGVSAVSKKIAWASGTHGTYVRTIDGHTWLTAQVPGAESLDFRGVVGFSADEVFLMSSGPGEQSRIYHTADGGQHWQLQFTNTNPKGFFDSIAFWDRTHGIVLGDPIPDETGKLKFEVLMTEDGKTWHAISPARLPLAMEGEGAFAASNSCVAILGRQDPNIWFASGGKVARVFHSADRGQNWEVFDTPIVHGDDSQGIFSIAFRDADHGVIAGGDYKHPEEDGPNLAFTDDGGKTWTVSKIFPQSYYSAVAYDREYVERQASGGSGKNREPVDQARVRLFLIGPKFIYDFRPPQNPVRISPVKKFPLQFNAVSAYPDGGALIVGPKGSIVTVP